jgi:hypothetical protein
MAVKEGMISIFPTFQPLRIKYKDIFDMKEFYIAIYEWLEENGWKDQEENLSHWERFYKERVGQGGVKEIWIQWRPYKVAEGAPLTYYLDFNFHCVGLMKTEVIKEGRKMKVNKGEVELVIKAFIEKNYEKGFKSDSILKHILKLFNNRIYHKVIEQRRKELYQETYALQNFIKQWLKLKRYLPYEESKNFFPSYAWPSHLKE